MRTSSQFIGQLLGGTVVLFIGGYAYGQTLLERASTIDFSATYGGGPDVFQPSGSVADGDLVLNDLETLAFSDSQSGLIPGKPPRPWSAGVSFNGYHALQITGSIGQVSRIAAEGEGTATASASGEGLASLMSANPGNQLTLTFSLASDTTARLDGRCSFTADGWTDAGVRLERFNGSDWTIVFWSVFAPGGQGNFDESWTLAAGEYRVISYGECVPFAGFRPAEEYQYDYRLTFDDFCPGDINGDNSVDLADLSDLLTNYGAPSGAVLSHGDIDGDGDVDLADLSALLTYFGIQC